MISPAPKDKTTTWTTWIFIFVSFLSSVAFVFFAAMPDTPDGTDAGRGGALATAISFGFLFWREIKTENIFTELRQVGSRLRSPSPDKADSIVDHIIRILELRTGSQGRVNI